MNIVILGLTTTSRGGIPQYTKLLFDICKIHHETQMVPIVRELGRNFYRSKDNQEVGDEDQSEQPLATLDPSNPLSWYGTARTVARTKPDLVVITWWATTYWILGIGVVINLLHRFSPNTKVVYWCHDVRFGNKAPFWPFMVNYSLAQADGYLIHTQPQAQELLKLRPDAHIKITPLPLVEGRFPNDNIPRLEARKRLQLPANGKIALFFGYIASYKGLDEFIIAGAKVRATVPDLHLVIAGEFWEDATPYKEKITQLGLGQATTIADYYIADEDVQLYFQAADVLILPYRDATQSGVATIGFDFNVPIIATEVGGMPEIITHNETGLLIPPHDAEALASILTNFFVNNLGSQLADGIRKQRDKLSPVRFLQAIETAFD